MQVTRRPAMAPSVPADSDTVAAPPVRRLDSRALLGTARSIEIVHGTETYRLCCTRQGKLILTK